MKLYHETGYKQLILFPHSDKKDYVQKLNQQKPICVRMESLYKAQRFGKLDIYKHRFSEFKTGSEQNFWTRG